MKNKNLSIIFDLDGTLWNSTGCASDIWNRVLEKHNDISFRMTKEKAAQLMGKTMEDIGKILFPEFSAEILHSCKMHESTTHVNGFVFDSIFSVGKYFVRKFHVLTMTCSAE